MARHNEVTLYGYVMEAPRLYYNSTDEQNPNRKLVRTMGSLLVIRGVRDFGANDRQIRSDLPIILTQNERAMQMMAKWTPGDIILLRGTICTTNCAMTIHCTNCGHAEQLLTTMAFVHPIYMKKIKAGLSQEEAQKELRENAEISNRVTMIGKVCRAPEVHVTERGLRIANYQLDIMRKYRIKEDEEKNRHDFPFVKSYGFVAENDELAIQEGGVVFVDGCIQTRDYLTKCQCVACGQEYMQKRTVAEIIPYSTEYLTGCKTMEEVEEIKKQRAINAGAAARANVFGE